MAYGLEGGGYTRRSYVWCAREGSIPLGGDSPRGVLAMGLYFSFSNCLLELRISQIFPRAGVQRDYPDGEMIFFGGNNVGLPLVLNSLRVKKKRISLNLQSTISINLKMLNGTKSGGVEIKVRKYVLGQRRKLASNAGVAN